MSLVYVYAIARGDRVPPPGLRGLDGGPVFAVREGDLVAFASAVTEGEFAEAPLNAHLADLEWLAPRAVRHQEVNAALAGACDPLVPLSFGTVFRDAAGVARMLGERRAEIGPRFDALRGKAEWIAVVRRDPAAAKGAVERDSEVLRGLRAEIASAPPGRAYLVTRRLDEAARQELRASDAGAIGAAVEAFERAGMRLFREPLVEDAGGGMLARFSVLASRDATGMLEGITATYAKSWAPRGYALELSGPWPAYRFSTVDLE
ncbi:MAG TPA: GvpL/GvpF family gas vesicle protein [Candidatus Limnocylindria bacterium]|nr:GvpL/GvpF family gas vesicle protein [Candidatus Limnocylindria bacterium]